MHTIFKIHLLLLFPFFAFSSSAVAWPLLVRYINWPSELFDVTDTMTVGQFLRHVQECSYNPRILDSQCIPTKLIHAGQIVQSDSTLGSLNLRIGNFVVVMLQKVYSDSAIKRRHNGCVDSCSCESCNNIRRASQNATELANQRSVVYGAGVIENGPWGRVVRSRAWNIQAPNPRLFFFADPGDYSTSKNPSKAN